MKIRPGVSAAVRCVVTCALVVGLAVACGSHHTTKSAAPPKPPPPPPKCPLTGVQAPGGRAPARPALAVKVENLPAARPQYGLSGADVIYEEPVEGGITRFIVIYQCSDAARIEPIRSGRIIDPEIVNQFGAHPLFAYAGAIQPAVAAIDASSLIDIGFIRSPNAYSRDPSRSAPHNLVSSTAALYAAGAAAHAPQTAPPPVFTYGALPSGAQPAASLHVPFPQSDVTWAWTPTTQRWSRSYADTGLATLGEGGSVTASNIIVMKVVLYASPYVEDATGAHENLLVLTGSGPAQIFRNGAVVTGTWNRPNLTQTTRYLNASGHVIPLTPGPTWVELVPTTITTSITP